MIAQSPKKSVRKEIQEQKLTLTRPQAQIMVITRPQRILVILQTEKFHQMKTKNLLLQHQAQGQRFAINREN